MTTNRAEEKRRLDDAAGTYATPEGKQDENNVNPFTVELALSRLGGGDALQMGLGNGYVAARLRPSFKRFVIVEGSRAVIEQFSDAGIGYEVVESLFEDYVPAAKFGVLLGNHILEHVDDPVSVLKVSRRWLRQGGTAMFTVPNAQSLHRRIGVEMGLLAKQNELNAQDRRLGHRRVYTIPELEEDIRSAGYRIREVRGYMIKLVSGAQMRGWPQELLEACYRVSLALPSEMCSNIAVFCENPG